MWGVSGWTFGTGVGEGTSRGALALAALPKIKNKSPEFICRDRLTPLSWGRCSRSRSPRSSSKELSLFLLSHVQSILIF